MFQEKAVRDEDKCTGMPFAVVSYPEPVSLSTQGGLRIVLCARVHCMGLSRGIITVRLSLVKTHYSSTGFCRRRIWTFSGEQYLLQNVGSYSAAGGLGVSCILPLLLPELS